MSFKQLENLLDKFGKEVEASRQKNRIKYRSRSQLENQLPETAGLYWIETDMPQDILLKEICRTTEKAKKTRSTNPEGVGFCKIKSGFQIVYSGTQANIRKRLLEHLFNEGNKDTAKLGCELEKGEFSKYSWFISFYELNDTTIRYAVESWWRVNVGWPPFCIR